MAVPLWPLLGALVAVLYVLYGKGRDDRTQYFGVGLIVAAVLYAVFALLYYEMDWIRVEAILLGAFLLLYRLSLRYGLVWIGVGWLLHPLWDYYGHVVGPGAAFSPDWYPPFCIGFDLVTAAGCLYLARTK